MLAYRVAYVLVRLLEAYQILIVISAILSWFPMREGTILGDIRSVLYRLTEPYIGIFRRFLGPVSLGGMYIDFSPLIALVVLTLLERVIVGILL